MQNILSIPLPPFDDIIQQYGYGFGNDFDIDYDLIMQAHTDKLSNNTILLPGPGGGTQPTSVLQIPPPNTANIDGTTTTRDKIYLLPPPFNEHGATAVTTVSTRDTSNYAPAPLATPAAQPGCSKGHHSKFSPTELKELTHVVYSVNPYGAKHGDKKT